VVSPVTIGNATLYLGDCREILPSLPKADAVVTDPPYGIREARGKNASRTKPRQGIQLKMPGRTIVARDFGNDGWDDDPLDTSTIDLIRNGARWSIIFGGNYYALPPSKCWLVWDKLNGDSDFADCELAWTNLPKAVRRIRHMWNGMLREGMEPRGFHPTQKPIGVMAWCIQQLPGGVDAILDPLMGSGTTGVAALRMGRKFIGIEIKRQYFEVACQRLEQAERQGDIFRERPLEPAQAQASLFQPESQ